MSHGRWSSILVSLLAISAPMPGSAEENPGDFDTPYRLMRPSVAELRRAGSPGSLSLNVGNEPDTVWIGHVGTTTGGVPGTLGGYGPYHVGRGPARYGVLPNGNDGIWDFDHFHQGETDELQGWWPIRLAWRGTSGKPLNDRLRPWSAIDFGNQANYTLNQSSSQRTFGVTGIWHRDTFAPGPGIDFSAIDGNASAWCGLRAHGDNSVVDNVAYGGTGNAFNEDAVQYAEGRPAFPGVPEQSQQYLYRHVLLQPGQDLRIEFDYKAELSADVDRDPATRAGYFLRDPLKIPSLNDANFISSSDADANAPVDSFRLFVGIPVNPDSIRYSDGSVGPISDPKHRWLSEIIVMNSPTLGDPWTNYYDVWIKAGDLAQQLGFNQPAEHFDRTFSWNDLVQKGIVALFTATAVGIVLDMLSPKKAPGSIENCNQIRPRGVMLDNVKINGVLISGGDFESAGAIDNSLNVSPLDAFKSTGKAPATYWHRRYWSELPQTDPCGIPGSPNRVTNYDGNVISSGDPNNNEKRSGPFLSADQDRFDGFISPTINLRSDDVGLHNAMGIDKQVAGVSDDIVLRFEAVGAFGPLRSGDAVMYGFQSYPVLTPGTNVPRWGPIKTLDYFLWDERPQSRIFLGRAYAEGLIETSNPTGIPDSMRVFLGRSKQCKRFNIPQVECELSTPAYFDNISIGFVDKPNDPGLAPLFPRGASAWVGSLFQSTFPFNSNDNLAGDPAKFDTCAALVKTGLNIAMISGDATRLTVPGDTALVYAAGPGMRLDLVFRILPGPGNHVTLGDASTALRQVPTAATPAASGELNFWGQYLADNGYFGTGAPMNGQTAGPGHTGGVWDRNRWNSARCDTAEQNLFPVRCGRSGQRPGWWASMYHESDPKFQTLGIRKRRCFFQDTTNLVPTNITCTGVPDAYADFPSRTGYKVDEVPGFPGQTREYTKILPDGIFTPGTHVQYFFRRSALLDPSVAQYIPDTSFVAPQPGTISFDARRWESFDVLPDQWKNPMYSGGSPGFGCMLVVNLADGRGTETAWIGTADSIGLSHPAKYGAHNGWHASGSQGVYGVSVTSDSSFAVTRNVGQAGTLWDYYSVRGSDGLTSVAGSLGSRLGAQPSSGDPAYGKESRQGPTPAMLRAYYRSVVLLTGDQSDGVLGPYGDHGQHDVGLLSDFITNPIGGGTPRAVMVQGSGWLTSEFQPRTGHPSFAYTQFGADLIDPSYREISGNTNEVVDLIPSAGIDGDTGPYGVSNDCRLANAVMGYTASTPVAEPSAYYEDVGAGGPYVAGVYAAEDIPYSRFARTLVEGFDLATLGSRYTLFGGGRLTHFLKVMTGVFSSFACPTLAAPVGVGDWFAPIPPAARDFLRLGSANPAQTPVTIRFGVAASERVRIAIVDIAGRRVRLLTDWVFVAGDDHHVVWDGRDDRGNRVRPGVYFCQLRSPRFSSHNRVVLLSP